jgi:hypothetical protein
MGLSFTIAAGAHQRHSRVGVPSDSRSYFTVLDSNSRINYVSPFYNFGANWTEITTSHSSSIILCSSVAADTCFSELLSSNGHLCGASLIAHFRHPGVMSYLHIIGLQWTHTSELRRLVLKDVNGSLIISILAGRIFIFLFTASIRQSSLFRPHMTNSSFPKSCSVAVFFWFRL